MKIVEVVTRESVYPGMIGIMEIAKFMQLANERQKQQFRKYVDSQMKEDAWKLVQKVIGVNFDTSNL